MRTGAAMAGTAARPPIWNCPTSWPSVSASVSRLWLAAVACSTIAAFCWVTWSIWLTAELTSRSPVDCSCAEAAISRDQTVQLVHLCDDPAECVAGFTDQPHPGCDLRAGRRDQRLDLLGGIGRALRQGAHFGGDHREAAPGIAGAGRLDPGIERQQVGLEGDLVDHADDIADLLGGGLDPGHRRDGLMHDDAGALGIGSWRW